jgi:hypothetical protein
MDDFDKQVILANVGDGIRQIHKLRDAALAVVLASRLSAELLGDLELTPIMRTVCNRD